MGCTADMPSCGAYASALGRKSCRPLPAHQELYRGSSGAPVCRDTSGTSPRLCDTAWLHTLMRSHRMTSALNACARRGLRDACARAAAWLQSWCECALLIMGAYTQCAMRARGHSTAASDKTARLLAVQHL